jgi:hypothetical protein
MSSVTHYDNSIEDTFVSRELPARMRVHFTMFGAGSPKLVVLGPQNFLNERQKPIWNFAFTSNLSIAFRFVNF